MSGKAMTSPHEWSLVGPWYRWESEEDPGIESGSRPILQKYASTDFISNFLENPQKSLIYLDEDFTGDKGDPDSIRKIFLDTHSRHYIIVCELHCNIAGFPSTTRDQVCEAGFVVRRRRTLLSTEVRKQIEVLLYRIRESRSKLKKVAQKEFDHSKSVGAMSVSTIINKVSKSCDKTFTEKYVKQLNKAKLELSELVTENDIQTNLEGWLAGEHTGFGQWQVIDETVEEVEEEIFPLYPLIPDPAIANHSSGGRTIWYGVLPVGSLDNDYDGNPRYDDRHTYEVSCFVRRHRFPCPVKAERNDCKGEIIWSRPTEPYRLAPHMDLIGTSNRITTIQLPSFDDLKKQVDKDDYDITQGVGVAMVTPANSTPQFDVTGVGEMEPKGVGSNPSICFFAIPLITIVAMFVFRLFLPIVVFLFGLWFLLRLKLCILPSLSVGLDISLELEAELDFDISLDVDISANLDLMVSSDILGLFNTEDERITLLGKLESDSKNTREQGFKQIGNSIVAGSVLPGGEAFATALSTNGNLSGLNTALTNGDDLEEDYGRSLQYVMSGASMDMDRGMRAELYASGDHHSMAQIIIDQSKDLSEDIVNDLIDAMVPPEGIETPTGQFADRSDRLKYYTVIEEAA